MTPRRSSPVCWIRWTRVKKWGTLLGVNVSWSLWHQMNTKLLAWNTPSCCSCGLTLAGGPNLPRVLRVSRRVRGGCSRGWGWLPADTQTKRLVRALCSNELLWSLLLCTKWVIACNTETEVSCIPDVQNTRSLPGNLLEKRCCFNKWWLKKPKFSHVNFHFPSFPLSSSCPLLLPTFLSLFFLQLPVLQSSCAYSIS